MKITLTDKEEEQLVSLVPRENCSNMFSHGAALAAVAILATAASDDIRVGDNPALIARAFKRNLGEVIAEMQRLTVVASEDFDSILNAVR